MGPPSGKSAWFAGGLVAMAFVAACAAAPREEPTFGGRGVEPWRALLHHPDASVRECAARALGRLAPASAPAAAELVDCLDDTLLSTARAEIGADARGAAIEALARLGPAADPLLRATIEEGDPWRASGCALALFLRVHDEGITVDWLVEEPERSTLEWEECSASEAWFPALARSGTAGREQLDLFVNGMWMPSRIAAAAVLAEHGSTSEQALAVVESASEHPLDRIAAQALWGWGRSATPPSEEELRAALSRESPLTAVAAAALLLARDRGDAPAQQRLRAALATGEESLFQATVARLDVVPDDIACELLGGVVADAKPARRLAAAMALLERQPDHPAACEALRQELERIDASGTQPWSGDPAALPAIAGSGAERFAAAIQRLSALPHDEPSIAVVVDSLRDPALVETASDWFLNQAPHVGRRACAAALERACLDWPALLRQRAAAMAVYCVPERRFGWRTLLALVRDDEELRDSSLSRIASAIGLQPTAALLDELAAWLADESIALEQRLAVVDVLAAYPLLAHPKVAPAVARIEALRGG